MFFWSKLFFRVCVCAQVYCFFLHRPGFIVSDSLTYITPHMFVIMFSWDFATSGLSSKSAKNKFYKCRNSEKIAQPSRHITNWKQLIFFPCPIFIEFSTSMFSHSNNFVQLLFGKSSSPSSAPTRLAARARGFITFNSTPLPYIKKNLRASRNHYNRQQHTTALPSRTQVVKISVGWLVVNEKWINEKGWKDS